MARRQRFAVVKAQQALRADPSLAAEAARRIFPPEETKLIGALVARDAPFFDPAVSPDVIDGCCRFAQSIGQLTGPLQMSSLSPLSSSTCGPPVLDVARIGDAAARPQTGGFSTK